MDESTFETFEEELGKPLQEVPPQKPFRQARTGGKAEMYAQRRVQEEAPNVQQVPKMIPREHPVSGASKSKRVSRGLRHRALPDLRLLKKRDTKFSERRRKGRREIDETKERRTKEKEMKVKEVKEEEEYIEEMMKPKKPAKENKHKQVKKERISA